MQFKNLKSKRKIIIVFIVIITILGATYYMIAPRFDVNTSKTAIQETNNKLNAKTQVKSKQVLYSNYVGYFEIKNKINKANIFNNADELTLLNNGAGIEKNISTPLKSNDFTFIKGHKETVMYGLNNVVLNDIIEITLKNNEKLKYKVNNIHSEKYGDNSAIYRYTSKKAIALISCDEKSRNKKNPELVLIVEAVLI